MLTPYAESGFAQGTSCPTAANGGNQRGVWTVGSYPVPGGHVAHWEADAPGNIGIIGAHVPEMQGDNGSAYWGEFFYWQSGNSGWLTNLNGGSGSWPSASGWQSFSPSSYFGWELNCNAATQCGSTSAYFDVFDLQLEAYEYQTPTIIAGPVSGGRNLWYQAGKWVHGSLPVDIAVSDPSGVCRAEVSWDGQDVQDTGERPPNDAYWDQCDPNHVSDSQQVFFAGATVNTASAVPTSATGVPLVLMAHNASVIPWIGTPDWSRYAETLNVDNLPVGLSVSGPTDVPVTAGTQYVTATATSGPSGVGSIMCSVDGSRSAPEQLSGAGGQTASAQVPISGLGVHTVRCYATNRAVDGTGAPTVSPTQTWSLKIGEPVRIYAAFPRVTRTCRRVRERIGKRIKRVRRCTGRTQEQPVTRVRFGHSVTLNGSVATADGSPLAHVAIRVLTAPDDDSYQWGQAMVATTAGDGSWSVTLPSGPSRLVQAVYDGGPTLERAASTPVRVVVPASFSLRVRPADTHWGGHITITGRLRGGFIPPAGELVVLWIGWNGGSTEIGHVYARANGRFSTKYTFLRGQGTETYRLWAASARESDYPFAPARSKAAGVRVT